MKYTFFYYENCDDGERLLYAGNCVDVNNVKSRHKRESECGYARNGYDACFYEYMRDNGLKCDDLRFEYITAELNTSIEVIQKYNPVCNEMISELDMLCILECYIYTYMYSDKLLYIKSSFDVMSDHQKNIDDFKSGVSNLFLFEYMRFNGLTFDDVGISYCNVGRKTLRELYEYEDIQVMSRLPICNTTLNCVRSNKDMFRDLHDQLLMKPDAILRYKCKMNEKLNEELRLRFTN